MVAGDRPPSSTSKEEEEKEEEEETSSFPNSSQFVAQRQTPMVVQGPHYFNGYGFLYVCLFLSASLLGLLVTMHFALCSLACRPFRVEEEVAVLVVVFGGGMFRWRLVLLVTMHFALCSFACRPFRSKSWWLRSSSTSTVVCLWVVLLENTQHALCLRARRCSAVACTAGFTGVDASRAVFPSLSSGLRCSASWPVWTRRTVARSSSFPAVTCARFVLLVLRLAMCSLWLSAGPRAGRYYAVGWFYW